MTALRTVAGLLADALERLAALLRRRAGVEGRTLAQLQAQVDELERRRERRDVLRTMNGDELL